MTLKATILGCGSSGGVPRVGGDWGVCNPKEPKNRRTRCSLLLEYWVGSKEPSLDDKTIILIDTSPDLREQLLSSDVKRIDALLYTHDHADQTHGIDDLRALAYRMRKKIPTYMDEHTHQHLSKRFDYCFEVPDGRHHPSILEMKPLIKGGESFVVNGPGGGVDIKSITLSHGPTPSLGFKFENKLVYSPDLWDIPDKSIKYFEDTHTWIIDSLRYSDHPTHFNADKALAWIAKTRTKQGILTNLHIDMDYETLSNEIFGNTIVAYDKLEIIIY